MLLSLSLVQQPSYSNALKRRATPERDEDVDDNDREYDSSEISIKRLCCSNADDAALAKAAESDDCLMASPPATNCESPQQMQALLLLPLLHCLPTELLIMISNHLLIKDILALSQTCRNIRNSLTDRFFATLLNQRISVTPILLHPTPPTFAPSRAKVAHHAKYLCVMCDARTCLMHDKYFIRVCESCEKLPETRMTADQVLKECKTVIKSIKDLDELHYDPRGKPCTICGYSYCELLEINRRTYLRMDVEKLVNNIMRARRDAEEQMKMEKQENLIKRQRLARANRLEEIQRLCERVGITMPVNSKLCRNYVMGTQFSGFHADKKQKLTARHIVDHLLKVHVLLDHSQYREYLPKSFPHVDGLRESDDEALIKLFRSSHSAVKQALSNLPSSTNRSRSKQTSTRASSTCACRKDLVCP